MSENKDQKRLTRREFIFACGGLVGAAIIGWFGIPKLLESSKETGRPSDKPELLDSLQVRLLQDSAEIYDVSDSANPILVCQVNDIGGLILGQINGKNSYEDILQCVIPKLKVTLSHPEKFASRTALFIAGMAEAGFLKQPFYMNVVENQVVS